MLEEEPELLLDVIEARHRERIPGLLDLDKAWHALDLMLGADEDDLLGDAVLARSGKKFGPEISYGRGRLLSASRVAKVSRALDALAESLVEDRYEDLRGKEVHGGYGPKEEGPAEYAEELEELGDDEEKTEREELTTRFESLRAFFREASKRGDAVLSIVV
jgi:hypothetical protein